MCVCLVRCTTVQYWVERESELQGRVCQLQTERESEDRKFREQLEKRSEQLKEKDAEIERYIPNDLSLSLSLPS